MSELVAKRDNRYVASFDEGTHQGVAEPHYLELELDEATETWDAVTLLAYGWVYPTDSSINVALGQGKHPIPRGVAMEGRDAKGDWVVLHPDLGFPAGKLKTMVVDVPRLPDGTRPRRLRLRTNLEIYWDWIGQAPRLDPESGAGDAPRPGRGRPRLPRLLADGRCWGRAASSCPTTRSATTVPGGATSSASTPGSATCASCSPGWTTATSS